MILKIDKESLKENEKITSKPITNLLTTTADGEKIMNRMEPVVTSLLHPSKVSTKVLQSITKVSENGGSVIFGLTTFAELASLGASLASFDNTGSIINYS